MSNWSVRTWVLISTLILAGFAEPELQGKWQMEGNPYRSEVSLQITGSDILARAGCLRTGRPYAAEAGRLRYTGPGLEMEASCVRDELRPEAWAYWSRVLASVGRVESYRIEGSTLVLTTTQRETLVFHRLDF